MKPETLAALFAIVLVVVIVGFLVVAAYNAVVTLGQQASKAWANIDIVLKQRHDELPNLVEAVKDLMAYEQATLTRITELRAAYSSAEPIPAQMLGMRPIVVGLFRQESNPRARFFTPCARPRQGYHPLNCSVQEQS